MSLDHWIAPVSPDSRTVVHVRDDAELSVRAGLAANPAAPDDVLLTLLGKHAEAVPSGFRRRPALSEPVLDAAVRHPSAEVRAAVAGNRHFPPAQRLRFTADANRKVLEALRADKSLEVPDQVFGAEFDRLLSGLRRGLLEPAELRSELIDLVGIDRRYLRPAVHHADPAVRAAAGWLLSGPIGDHTRDELLPDAPADVQAACTAGIEERALPAVAGREHLDGNGYHRRYLLATLPLDPGLLREFLEARNQYDWQDIAANPTLPPEVVDQLFEHDDPAVRRRLADRADLTPRQLARLAADPDIRVRTDVSVHPALTEQQRAAIVIDPEQDHVDPRPDPVRSREWARSVNPFLRRRAARDTTLPPDLVTLLAGDDDPGVRLIVAHDQPAAPPELLLRVFRESDECRRGRLVWLPNFPRAGLAHHADDPDPALRWLATADPQAPPAVLDRLTRDPSELVRRGAASHPGLPVGRVVELAGEGAGAAAANPALPPEVMRALAR